eukprot:5411406-Prymnesium_polylepis.1
MIHYEQVLHYEAHSSTSVAMRGAAAGLRLNSWRDRGRKGGLHGRLGTSVQCMGSVGQLLQEQHRAARVSFGIRTFAETVAETTDSDVRKHVLSYSPPGICSAGKS